MIDGERVVALVPARGGSQGIPRKNLQPIDDKPLVAWPIEVAQAVEEIDSTVVSTDDEDIAEVAAEYGAEVVKRPERLAHDDSPVIETIRHAIDTLADEDDPITYMTLLEPTCPFRAPEDVRECLTVLVEEAYDSVATFVEAELNPHRAWTIEEDRPAPVIEDANPWLPRQHLPEAYQLNGGAYAFVVDALPEEGLALLFGDYGAVVMPPERSIDIDTELDLELARVIAARGS